MYVCSIYSKQNGSFKRDENQSAQYRHHRSTEKFRSEKNRVMCTLQKMRDAMLQFIRINIAVLGSAAISFALSLPFLVLAAHKHSCTTGVDVYSKRKAASESLALIFEHMHTFFRSILNGKTATECS